MYIGSKIRKIRELKNIKQEYLAQQLNLSITSYGKIERDEVDISLSRVHQIAKILKISTTLLIDFDVDEILYEYRFDHNNLQQVIIYMQENLKVISSENSRLLKIIENITSKTVIDNGSKKL